MCGGQGIPDEDELDQMTIDDIMLRRAEGLLLQSILRKMQSEDGRSGVYISFFNILFFQTILEFISFEITLSMFKSIKRVRKVLFFLMITN